MFVKNVTRKRLLASSSKICSSFFSRSRGLMFSSKIKDKAYVLAFPEEERVDLHMFFVFFPIDVLFVDKRKKVVEIKKGFQPFTTYSARKKARYVIELPEGAAGNSRIGDRIEFFDVSESESGKKVRVSEI
ncbi:DUF192 domain-containing protein [Candidatus Woesearchaeota archaeon]|nr:DUF192 domain-containing protein [Candidatus Woesearchaeota archaeon]